MRLSISTAFGATIGIVTGDTCPGVRDRALGDNLIEIIYVQMEIRTTMSDPKIYHAFMATYRDDLLLVVRQRFCRGRHLHSLPLRKYRNAASAHNLPSHLFLSLPIPSYPQSSLQHPALNESTYSPPPRSIVSTYYHQEAAYLVAP